MATSNTNTDNRNKTGESSLTDDVISLSSSLFCELSYQNELSFKEPQQSDDNEDIKHGDKEVELPSILQMDSFQDEEADIEDIDGFSESSTNSEEKRDELDYPYGEIVDSQTHQCNICWDSKGILRDRKCCQITVCDECMQTYLTTQVQNSSTRIQCISSMCSEYVHFYEMMCRLPPNYKDIYYRRLIDANYAPNTKTCPRCSYIHSISPNDVATRKKKPDLERGYLVVCPDCNLEWCFVCHAPWHFGVTCKDFQKGDKLVKAWAKEFHYGQKNASRCPKCKIFIQRDGGCDYMSCSACNTSFCYRCGKGTKCNKVFGNHYEKLAIYGCKYNFLPERPVARKAIRGTVFGAKVVGGIFLGGLLVAAGAIFVAVSPIVVPAYIGHRIRKKKKRQKYQRAIHLRCAQNHQNPQDPERYLEQRLKELQALDKSETADLQYVDLEVMATSQSSSNSTETEDVDQNREDEILRVGVQGQREGLENIDVWIHYQDPEKSGSKEKPNSDVKGHSNSTSAVTTEKEVIRSGHGRGCFTTAKLLSNSDQDEVVLHVVTKSHDDKKLPKDEENKGSNSEFVEDESERSSENKGCFVKLFGTKMQTMTREKEKEMTVFPMQISEPKGKLTDERKDKTEDETREWKKLSLIDGRKMGSKNNISSDVISCILEPDQKKKINDINSDAKLREVTDDKYVVMNGHDGIVSPDAYVTSL